MDNPEKAGGNQPVSAKSRNWKWIVVVVSVLVLTGIGTQGYLNYCNDKPHQDLGTHDNPEEAFKETQKALSVLSRHLKIGMESVQYIQEYDNSKKIIFKQPEPK